MLNRRRKYISESMLNSETLVAYSFAASGFTNLENDHFIVSLSHSQGFAWNQDLFASQYQQMCKVVYDGHNDNMDKLLDYIKLKTEEVKNSSTPIENTNRENDLKNFYHENDNTSSDVIDCAIEDDSKSLESNEVDTRHRRRSNSFLISKIRAEVTRPRRKSGRSVSFVSDSKNGNYSRNKITEIDINGESKENLKYKWLASKK
ncbi:hypothetical protein Kpol_530p26 [Vanderwaltozyma polyspora DSM 70294]|uniref:Uncharacterized protein n=1 Tax=Vanderwaltozyma polyspora (strain ATCC 22028 / DSM 70294 / BCRC 21397 / CBS 2163 / NBRC 10782 / NRRL Y-8283 / UCD 57-17) TaxID=436907 RepID=A7TL00_VANPO|nr:uncharacterized protein Kpol_530p26 [Vanderwaltozyma polyspora DSM 70294]EDO17056.1 hypothetical protein Kpol_530p26 [Vanderwaltozyma polyspora DSM 70294]